MVLSKQETYCEWIKYDYRTMCPREHNIDNPYWRIPESRMEVLKYCPYCGRNLAESESKRYMELAKSYVQGLRAGLAESEK